MCKGGGAVGLAVGHFIQLDPSLDTIKLLKFQTLENLAVIHLFFK